MRLITILVCGLSCLALSALIRPADPLSPGVQSALDHFRIEAPAFAVSCAKLTAAIRHLPQHDASTASIRYHSRHAPPNAQRNLPASSVRDVRLALIDCRRHYKKIESFLEYFFRSSARIYNGPPKFEAEEPDMEYQSPVGLQVIESLLLEKTDLPASRSKDIPSSHSRPAPKRPIAQNIDRNALLQQAQAIESAAADLPALLYDWTANDAQLLESLRIELIRVMALDITGYEAPLLKSGIAESADALASLRDQLQPYLRKDDPRSDSLRFFLDNAIRSLRDHPGFDDFDRLAFLSGSALPLQHQLAIFIRENGAELNTSGVLNYSADNLFSSDALIIDHFPGDHTGNKDAKIRLGKILFSEKSLSGKGIKSCASCHDPGRMFTDGQVTPLAFDGHHHLERNAPSLLYSGFQYSQFWDGRVKSLEQQVRTVLCDPSEMNADTMALIRWWKAQCDLVPRSTQGSPAANPLTESIRQVAATADPSENSIALITTSLAAYVRSLHPMNSAFDRYIRGDHQALNESERHGANLFMGKAQCATCHFIPLFNGLIPPDYTKTEFEVLGTTRSDHFQRTSLSSDPGRYKLYPFIFYKHAFKTPTVRNAAVTAPYMHNGSIHTLEKLVEFYNKGGGAGLGLSIDDQTLSSRPLHLSKQESQDIILFIHDLTDSICIKR